MKKHNLSTGSQDCILFKNHVNSSKYWIFAWILNQSNEQEKKVNSLSSNGASSQGFLRMERFWKKKSQASSSMISAATAFRFNGFLWIWNWMNHFRLKVKERENNNSEVYDKLLVVCRSKSGHSILFWINRVKTLWNDGNNEMNTELPLT